MRIVALSVAISLCLFGCSSSKKKDAEDPDSKWDMGKVDTEPKPSDYTPAGDDDDDDDDDEPASKPKPKPLSQADDYEINERDCDALARAYGRAWKNDELAKLNKRKLKKEQFDKAAADLDNNSAEMENNWRSECYGTVGTAYLRSRLKCALKAKSMQRFNDCMDGLADADK